MAGNKRRKRKKNPSKAQIIVLAVGGVAGIGLLSYAGYLYWKEKKALPQGGGQLGAGPPGSTYEYRIAKLPVTSRNPFFATIYLNGQVAKIVSGSTREKASKRARKWISNNGGIAICAAGCPQDVPSGEALPAA